MLGLMRLTVFVFHIAYLIPLVLMGVTGTAHSQANVAEASTAKTPHKESDFMTRLREIAEEIENRLIREDPNPIDTNESESAGGAGGSSGGEDGGADNGDGDAADQEDTGNDDSYGYDAESPREPSTTKQTPGDPRSIRTPPDIRPGQDETIIMKNLREAAEKETDSKIREKLWDEYRKYKKEQ